MIPNSLLFYLHPGAKDAKVSCCNCSQISLRGETCETHSFLFVRFLILKSFAES